MMEVPQLHGFGPAANRLLEAYNTLQKVRAYTSALHRTSLDTSSILYGINLIKIVDNVAPVIVVI